MFSDRSLSKKTGRQKCSLATLPIVAIILGNLINLTAAAIDTNKQLNYYQTLQRHLNDFTVKDDNEDLLALPSESVGASVAVVAPPEIGLPITQYAKSSTNSQQEQAAPGQRHKKSKSRLHRQQQAENEDTVAQESVQGDMTATFAEPPPSFTSSKILHHRSGSNSDNVAQESYQNGAYAPPPSPSTSSLSEATGKSYDQYLRSTSESINKDNHAQESYNSNSYAPPPPPANSNNYEQYHRGSIVNGAGSVNDNNAQTSYPNRAYSPSPSSVVPAGAPPPPSHSYYDQHHQSNSIQANDNRAQESYQPPLSYAPPPPPPPSPSAQLSMSPVAGKNDNHAQESYRGTMSYAPPPPPPPPPSNNYYPAARHESTGRYQNGGAPPPPPPPPPSSTAYHPPYSPSYYRSPEASPSTHHQRYHNYPSYSPYYKTDHQGSHSSYPESGPVPAYSAYPATTPVPAARAQYHRHLSYFSSPKPTILQPASTRTSSNNKNVIASASDNSPLLAHHPHLTSIDKHQQEQRQQQTSYSSYPSYPPPNVPDFNRETFEFSPAPPGPPPPPPPPPLHLSPAPHAMSSPSPKDQSIAEASLHKQQKLLEEAIGSGIDIYKTAITNPKKLLGHGIKFLTSLKIPKEHYLNVVSFVGVYLFLSILFYGQDDLKGQKCEGGDEHMHKEWHYHVGRRFVPAVHKVDEKLQRKFLKLFKGLHLEDDDDDGSSSEEDNAMINHVNDMCPRGAFFYSLAPMHLEARMQVQQILVAQPSPVHVYAAAKALLYKHKIHPKIWYLGLIAAALERPDMTGFKLAHPIDAIPDWFIPADLIQDEMDKYKARSLARSAHKRVRRAAAGNSTKTVLTTTLSPTTIITTTLSSLSSFAASAGTTENSNMTSSSGPTKITRKPLLYTRRSTTTRRPSAYGYYTGDSGSVENFVLDGTPPHLKGDNIHDWTNFDEDEINNSVQQYQQINTIKEGKYKPKKKVNSSKKPVPDEQSQQDQDTSTSVSAEQEAEPDASIASGSTEADNLSSTSSATNSAQQTSSANNNDGANQDDEVAVIAPAPPSVRPSHLTSSHHNAIKVGDLTVVVGSGSSLLNDIPTYNLLDDRDKKRHHGNGHGNKKHKKGHKKGKGKDKKDKCIVVDGKVGRDNGIENKLWYFREDIMVSQNHWYWHLQHPVNSTMHPDRRAELFFFTHRQFLARYNSERLSNGLTRMLGMNTLGHGGILLEPYHSHLADVASGKFWTPRYPKRLLRDIRHEHNPDIIRNIMLKDVSTIYSRLMKSVQTGIMISNKGLLPIRNSKGIEPLANTLEATDLSINPAIYDAQGLHNLGHLVIGLVEDPDWGYRKPPGVMAEVATSMRDPIFYNYHELIDNVFEKHKETLQPYKVVGGEFPLLWKGVRILEVQMMSKGDGPLNQLRTFWTKKKFELAPSVDRSTDREDDHAKICAVHLAHEPFTFKITVERKSCTKSKSGKGTIRIFIAPRYDEMGRRIHLREQRRLMIQLDAFQAKLRVGRNVITRRSHDSSLTQPWTKHMHDFEEENHSGAADFCGCGWPQHLYIPKGSHKGMPFDLFVMVTNYDEDHVPNHPKDLEVPETCNSPYLFCGHPRRKYPDARPMGYPWDRPPYKTPIPCLSGHTFAAVICKSFNLVAFKPIDVLEEFVAKAPNMKSIVFDIKHIDKLVKGYHRRN